MEVIMRYSLILLPVFLLIVFFSPLHATVIHVPEDSTTIQGGINGAVDGDTVMVHPGTYYEHDIDFLGKAITVMSTDPADSAIVASTIVNADSLGSVFIFQFGEDTTSILTGITVTGGYAVNGGGIYCQSSSPTIANNTITGNAAVYVLLYIGVGGGIYCSNSSPAILNNTISDNIANYGGGIYCQDFSSPVIKENTISGNDAFQASGIYCHTSSPTITDNTISENTAASFGGGIYLEYDSSPAITNNIISWNTANSGGGIHCVYSSSPAIANNTISGNTANGFSGGGIWCSDFSSVITNNAIMDNIADFGGGIYLTYYSSPVITNNILTGNTALRYGGGIYLEYDSSPAITNNTILNNTAVDKGGGICCWATTPVISNTILWDNSALEGPEIYYYSYYPTVIYCDVMGGWPGVGNINTDPLFLDSEYHLVMGSPCVDAGDPFILDACRPPGLGEERSDMGAYGGEQNCAWPPFNYDPVITSSPDTVAVVGFEYFYDVEADDSEGDTLYFYLQVSPSWLSIDSTTGVITGFPPLSAIGDTTITVLVEDGFGGSDSQTFPLFIVPQVNLTIIPGGTIIPRGELLEFDTHIQNYRENSVEGDYWLSVLLPNFIEVLIPEGLLNYSNPLHGQIFPNGYIELSNQLFVPAGADTGSYQLIGRIGQYPNGIFDEESFGFQVIE
jgi:parallel beta-helix repeat protein